MSLRWLITGGDGMLATDLVEELGARQEQVTSLSRQELDITDAGAVRARFREVRPHIAVNCAAFTKVDEAESHESIATAVNGSAVEFLSSAADQTDSLLMQISTDFVFDGRKNAPYEVNDSPAPLSAYGRSKLLGEFAAQRAAKHLILRTAWVFGVHGPNFVEAIRNQIRKGTNPLRVVEDQRGRPTYTRHLAQAIIRMGRIAHERPDGRGIVHYADEEECSWYDFAREIVRQTGSDVEVKPVSTSEFPRPAPRPAYSVLSTARYERLTGVKPESWREGLEDYLERRA